MSELAQITETQKIINELEVKYPGQFSVLNTVKHKCCKEIPVIAYNMDDKIIMFNEDIFDDNDETEAAFAFIGLLIKDKAMYCAIPCGYDKHLWNIATHIHIVERLNAMGDFELPQDAIDLDIDKTGTVEEIYQRVATISEDDLDQQVLEPDDYHEVIERAVAKVCNDGKTT